MMHLTPTPTLRIPWTYEASAAVTNLRKLFPDGVPQGGGKAIGLSLCERIAACWKSAELQVEVPQWTRLPKADFEKDTEKRDRGLVGHIIRSSAADEDWISGDSGCHASFPIPDFSSLLCISEQPREADAYVKQELRHGYGLVINVAHSHIEGTILIKICSGLERYIAEDKDRPYYTSATSDSESSVKVFSLEKRNVCSYSCNYRDSAFTGTSDQYWHSVGLGLFQALHSVGIDFPVELECIVPPNDPRKISLVQIRPIPAGKLTRIDTQPHKHSKIFFDSGVFNRPCDSDYSRYDIKNSVGYEQYIIDSDYSQENLIAILHPDRIDAQTMKGLSASQAYAWLINIGYKTILTPFALDPSFKHDKHIDEYSSSFAQQINERGNIISFPSDVLRNISQAASGKKIAVQADGMIARVYIGSSSTAQALP